MQRHRGWLAYLAAVLLWACLSAAAVTPAWSDQGLPSVDARIAAKAKEWFYRFQTGTVDRGQLNALVNAELTSDQVKVEGAKLRALGKLTSFTFVGSEPVMGAATGYYFALSFDSGKKVIEAIAFDANEKIAGIDFQILVPTTKRGNGSPGS